MLLTITVFVSIIAYLVGSINTSIILSRSIYGADIRMSGSGNAGATNMLRTHGKGIAIATLICDVLKGTLIVVIARWLDILTADMAVTANEGRYLLGNLKYIAGIFVVFGHDFPIYFGFKGGKGVATSLGVILALDWKIGLIVLCAALLVMIFTRYVSLGSISAAGIYPFIVFTYLLASEEDLTKCASYLIMSLILSVTLILKHHSNITKLKNGTENKLFAKKKEPLETDEESENIEDGNLQA